MSTLPAVRLDEDETCRADAGRLPPSTRDGGGVAQALGSVVRQGVGAGVSLLRATTTLGIDLVVRRGLPLALPVGPLGRVVSRDIAGRAAVAVRMDDADVAIDAASLEAAFPHATDRMLVLVPDAGASEHCWRRDLDTVGASYGTRLGSLFGWTPVHLRLDETAVTQAGVELSSVLQRLVDNWPAEVRRVALVGHAAGGLVMRAACGVLTDHDTPWTVLVSDVVALGTPHLVASPQRFAPVGRRLEEALAGITADQPDVPPLEQARYAVFVPQGTLGSNPLGQVLGDLLWWRQAALGRRRRTRPLFPTASRHEVSVHPHSMVNHPAVHRDLLDRLA